MPTINQLTQKVNLPASTINEFTSVINQLTLKMNLFISNMNLFMLEESGGTSEVPPPKLKSLLL